MLRTNDQRSSLVTSSLNLDLEYHLVSCAPLPAVSFDSTCSMATLANQAISSVHVKHRCLLKMGPYDLAEVLHLSDVCWNAAPEVRELDTDVSQA